MLPSPPPRPLLRAPPGAPDSPRTAGLEYNPFSEWWSEEEEHPQHKAPPRALLLSRAPTRPFFAARATSGAFLTVDGGAGQQGPTCSEHVKGQSHVQVACAMPRARERWCTRGGAHVLACAESLFARTMPRRGGYIYMYIYRESLAPYQHRQVGPLSRAYTSEACT